MRKREVLGLTNQGGQDGTEDHHHVSLQSPYLRAYLFLSENVFHNNFILLLLWFHFLHLALCVELTLAYDMWYLTLSFQIGD